MQEVICRDLGRIDYGEAWQYQEELFSKSVSSKLGNRNASVQEKVNNYFLFCEHPHVYTLGKSGSEDNLLLNKDALEAGQMSFFKINRGGDITYHGPGQVVGYPILDLDQFFTDIHKYLRFLEEVIIETLQHYGLSSGRVEGLTGVWIEPENPEKARKVCAMGVRCSRWVTMHGFALNVNTDMNYFKNIHPCGIKDKPVTSLALEIGRQVDLEEIKSIILANFQRIFNVRCVYE